MKLYTAKLARVLNLLQVGLLIVFCAVPSLQGQQGKVRLRVSDGDGDGTPLPCRVHLYDKDDKPQQPPDLPFWRDHFVCRGIVDLTLLAGSYRYEIERGPEYERATGMIEVASGGEHEINVPLRRLVSLNDEGWFSGDLHVHRPVADVPLLMQAEDLNVAPVITWWNKTDLWQTGAYPEQVLHRPDQRRFYHVMAGEDEREGGALLFFHLQRPVDITMATREYPSPMRFVREVHEANSNVWIDIEKPFWWDVPVWLASGQTDSIGLANNHMCRSTMYESEAWGRPRDSNRLPPPHGNGYWTQEIYYHLLNSGLRLPPSAGSASGVLPNPVGYNRVYVHLDQLSHDGWWDGLRARRSFVTNGPLLLCEADGKLPGHVFKVDGGRKLEINLSVSLISNDPISKIEVIKNGKVYRAISTSPALSQRRVGKIAFETSGWFLMRAVGDVPHTFRFASTAPYYVEVGDGQPRIGRASARFFLDWAEARRERVSANLDDPGQLSEVRSYHDEAIDYWRERVKIANAE